MVTDAEMDDCRCDGGQPKNGSRPCSLLVLTEAPARSYELLESAPMLVGATTQGDH
jgi:hypothetical protein